MKSYLVGTYNAFQDSLDYIAKDCVWVCLPFFVIVKLFAINNVSLIIFDFVPTGL